MAITPFKVEVAEHILQDLRERLDRTRWPDEIAGSGWDYGSNLDYIKELVEYWRTTADCLSTTRAPDNNGSPVIASDDKAYSTIKTDSR